MSREEYNGWSSYETWAVNLELCDDLAEIWREDKRGFKNVYELSEAFKSEVEDILFGWVDPQAKVTDMVCVPQSVWAQVSAWAERSLQNVNWDEIARHYPEFNSTAVEED